jgi:hypothetical protein
MLMMLGSRTASLQSLILPLQLIAHFQHNLKQNLIMNLLYLAKIKTLSENSVDLFFERNAGTFLSTKNVNG